MVNQTHADEVAVSCIVQLYERVKFLECGEKPAISSKQQHNLKKSWARFTKGDNDAAGLAMFLELFKIKPEFKKHFEFSASSASAQMQSSSRMIFHVSRVSWYIGEVIDKLDNLEEIVPQLKQVGSRHSPKGYNIPPTTFPFLGTALINCIKKTETMTDEDEKAWKEVFGWIVKQMVCGINESKVTCA